MSRFIRMSRLIAAVCMTIGFIYFLQGEAAGVAFFMGCAILNLLPETKE